MRLSITLAGLAAAASLVVAAPFVGAYRDGDYRGDSRSPSRARPSAWTSTEPGDGNRHPLNQL